MDKKHCNKCNEEKSYNEFYKHKSRKDGLQSLCKVCDKGYQTTLNCTDCGISFYLYHRNIKKRKSFLCKKCYNIHHSKKITELNKKRVKEFIFTEKGYAYERDKNKPHGYSLRHRQIVENFLNRKLNKEEVVHHIDGMKLNNSIENLWVTNSSGHRKAHRSLELISLFLFEKGLIKFDKNLGIYVLNDDLLDKNIVKLD